MKIITLSGLDGSGKSTQIKALQAFLESEGKKVFYFHAIQFGLAKKITDFKNKYCLICRLLGKCSVKTSQEKSVTKASWLTIQLRKLFLRIDLNRFRKLAKKLENEGYDYLVSDRYFYDSIVNIEYLTNIRHPKLDSESSHSNIIKPDLAIYLQTSPETIMSRERIPDQGIEYLKAKKELYDNKISEWNMHVIDGNQDKETVFHVILNVIQDPNSYK